MKPFDYYEVDDAKEEDLTSLLQTLGTQFHPVYYKQQILQQFRMISIVEYVAFGLFTMACVIAMMSPRIDSYFDVITLYMIVFVTYMMLHVMKSSYYECEELERSCKFSYGQIIWTRMILLCSLLMIIMAGFTFCITISQGVAFFPTYLLLLSFIFSTLLLSEGCYLLVRGHDIRLLLVIYIVVTLLMMHYIFPLLLTLSVVSELFLLVMLTISLSCVTKKLWKEMTLHEPVNYELN